MKKVKVEFEIEIPEDIDRQELYEEFVQSPYLYHLGQSLICCTDKDVYDFHKKWADICKRRKYIITEVEKHEHSK